MGIAEAALIAAVVGTGVSIQQNRQAAKSQRASLRAQQRIADLQAARERRQSIRSARQARAAIESGAALGGVADSSGALGGVGSVVSQGAANVSFLDQTQQLGQLSNTLAQQAVKFQSNAATAQAVGNFAGSIFQQQDGFKGLFQNSSSANTIKPNPVTGRFSGPI